MNTRDAFYITTPIYYVNDRPHLGHVYTTVIADIIARYHRLIGDDTFFLTGVDEHATKVLSRADGAGVSAQAWCDKQAASFMELFRQVEVTNDDFVRTSKDHHKNRVAQYVTAMLRSGDIYKGRYEGWYDPGQEEYVTETKAMQIDYKSEVSGQPLVKKTETNYFFRLSSYRRQLTEFYARCDAAGTPFVQPEARRREVLNRISEMDDMPISRSGTSGWGISMPDDPHHTIYVWIDALFNYLSFVDSGSGAELHNRRKYWAAGAVHLIAKDILWFHAAVWPALLMALQRCSGYEWVRLPSQVYCHSYWVSASGVKMSKSLGNFLDPETLHRLIAQFGVDALRWFLGTRGPLSVSDCSFSSDMFVHAYNADLANSFGNACTRVTQMIQQFFGGLLPPQLSLDALDTGSIARHVTDYSSYFGMFALPKAAESALRIVREVDACIATTQPFKLARSPSTISRSGGILYNCMDALRVASVLLWPFMPNTCEMFWRRISCKHYANAIKEGAADFATWSKWGKLEPGVQILTGEPMFPRHKGIVDD